MAKIRLICTTKLNGSFVEGGTVLEIGTDVSKEEAKDLKQSKIAEDFLSIEEIEEVKVEQTSLIDELTKKIEEATKYAEEKDALIDELTKKIEVLEKATKK